jgi:hypothetical protein
MASMIARVLPESEWHRLEVTGLGNILPDFRPEDVRPVVVEKDGEIVATGMVIRTVHFECLWVKPGSHAGIVRALMRALWSVGKQWGKLAIAQSCRPNVTAILSRMKGNHPLKAETFVLPLEIS